MQDRQRELGSLSGVYRGGGRRQGRSWPQPRLEGRAKGRGEGPGSPQSDRSLSPLLSHLCCPCGTGTARPASGWRPGHRSAECAAWNGSGGPWRVAWGGGAGGRGEGNSRNERVRGPRSPPVALFLSHTQTLSPRPRPPHTTTHAPTMPALAVRASLSRPTTTGKAGECSFGGRDRGERAAAGAGLPSHAGGLPVPKRFFFFQGGGARGGGPGLPQSSGPRRAPRRR